MLYRASAVWSLQSRGRSNISLFSSYTFIAKGKPEIDFEKKPFLNIQYMWWWEKLIHVTVEDSDVADICNNRIEKIIMNNMVLLDVKIEINISIYYIYGAGGYTCVQV